MFKMESVDCDDAISDLHQDLPAQDTLANDSLVRKIRCRNGGSGGDFSSKDKF